MATRLARKIGSYAIEKGIELNEAYVLPPTETGTISQASAADWSLFSGVAPTYQSGVGPAGGGGSWNFINDVSGGARLRSTNAATLATVNDREFTAGCWVKFNELPQDGLANSVVIFAMANIFTSGFAMFLGGATSTVGNNFTFTGGTTTPIDSGVTCVAGEWYLLSVIVSGTSTKYYINGVEVISVTRTLSTNCIALFIGNGTAKGVTTTNNICNVFIADNDAITASDLLEIYNVGTSDRIVNHYDGTAWQESYDQKVWNGTNWVQWTTPTYWNGSAWVAI